MYLHKLDQTKTKQNRTTFINLQMSPNQTSELSQILLSPPSCKQDPSEAKLWCKKTFLWAFSLVVTLSCFSADQGLAPLTSFLSQNIERADHQPLVLVDWLTDYVLTGARIHQHLVWNSLVKFKTFNYNYGMKGVPLKLKEFRASANRKTEVKVYLATSECGPDLSSFGILSPTRNLWYDYGD